MRRLDNPARSAAIPYLDRTVMAGQGRSIRAADPETREISRIGARAGVGHPTGRPGGSWTLLSRSGLDVEPGHRANPYRTALVEEDETRNSASCSCESC